MCASQTPATVLKTRVFHSQSLRSEWLIGAAHRWPGLLLQPLSTYPPHHQSAPFADTPPGSLGWWPYLWYHLPSAVCLQPWSPTPNSKGTHTHLSLQHHEKHLLSLKVCNLWFAPVPSFSKVRLRIEVTFRAMQPVRSHRCGHLRLPPLPRICQLNRKLASWALRPSVIQPLWFIRVMKAWPQLSLY